MQKRTQTHKFGTSCGKITASLSSLGTSARATFWSICAEMGCSVDVRTSHVVPNALLSRSSLHSNAAIVDRQVQKGCHSGTWLVLAQCTISKERAVGLCLHSELLNKMLSGKHTSWELHKKHRQGAHSSSLLTESKSSFFDTPALEERSARLSATASSAYFSSAACDTSATRLGQRKTSPVLIITASTSLPPCSCLCHLIEVYCDVLYEIRST